MDIGDLTSRFRKSGYVTWSQALELAEELSPYIEMLIEAEREACAKVCDEMEESVKRSLASCEHNWVSDEEAASVASDCAQAIRSRGQTND